MISRTIAVLTLAASAAAADLPAELMVPQQPLRFGAEQAQFDVRIDLAHGAPTLERVEDHLVLSAPLPADATLLRLRDLAAEPVTTDTGERLGLLLKPSARDQAFAPDHAFNRDRVLRLTFDLTPPWKTCAQLREVRASAVLTLGHGKPHEAVLAAKKGATAKADAFGDLEVIDAGDKGFTVRAPLALAGRFAGLVARDREGKDLPNHAKEASRTDAAIAWSIDAKPDRCASLALTWFVEVADERVAIAIPAIDATGGIPGIAGLVEGAGVPAPPLPKPAALKLPLQRAIAGGDHAEVARLLDGGADVDAVDADGRAALARAAAAGDEQSLQALLARKPTIAAAGRDGWTALHCAVAANDLACVRALLAAGADSAVQAKDGRSCLDLARDLGRWRIARVLLGNADGTL
jgi:hypothetical protein